MKSVSKTTDGLLSFTVTKCEECRHPFSDGNIEHYPECRYYELEYQDEEDIPEPSTAMWNETSK